ncbi:MAG: hypothetical protein QM762_13375 [Chryseolinea sp.]
MKASLERKLFSNYTKQHISSTAWNLKNHLAYKEPENGLLKGIYFNSSSFSASQFEPIAFIQPLFVPSDHVYFSFSLGLNATVKRQWWDYSEETVEESGRVLADEINEIEKRFFSKINASADFYRYYLKDKKVTVRYFEAVAYSCAYANLEGAEKELSDLIDYIKKKENITIEWVKEIYDNTLLLLDGNASYLFDMWEKRTREALKV